MSKVESILIDAETWGQRELLEEICSRYFIICLLYTSPSPRDATLSRMPSSA